MDLYGTHNIKSDELAVAGDLHLNSATPRSRLDDYADTSISKLESLRLMCVSRGYKKLFLLGDIFHKTQQPLSYLYRVISEFTKFKDSGIEVFAIVGNHDITYEKMEYLEKSALGILFQSGAVKPYSVVQMEVSLGYFVNIYGYHYPDPIQPVMTLGSNAKVNICMAHRFYNYSFSSSSLTDKMLDTLGYDIYVLGHDHVPYELVTYNGMYVVRPGRFMRGTSHSYNMEDSDVYIDIIRFSGDSDNPKVTFVREKLDVKPPEEIFVISSHHKDKSENLLEDLGLKVDSLLEKMEMSNKSGENSIYEVIDSMELDSRIKERIEIYLNQAGILRSELPIRDTVM